MSVVVGVDIGGTKIAAAVLDADPARVARVPTPGSPAAIVAAVASVIHDVAEEAEIGAVGVGSAGAFDPQGRVASATDLLPGWSGTPLATLLAETVDAPVVAVNDVHAAAVAEARRGAAVGVSSAIVVAIGTGIGGAVVLDGRVLTGVRGLAGSIGHLTVPGSGRRCSCGAVGHVEAIASGPAMESEYLRRVGGELPLRFEEIARLAETGDAEAADVIQESAAMLGTALASAAALVDPEMIVVGGGVSAVGSRLLDPLIGGFRSAALPEQRAVRVVGAAFGASATTVGAALLARDALERAERDVGTAP
ncbi:MAG: ROK family protein [Actinomycetales bacterium]|nr:ROK family protein [Actinomycetales bacterium]